MAAHFIAILGIFLVIFSTFSPLPHPRPQRKQEHLVQPHFFFHLEFNRLTTLPHPPKMVVPTFF